MPQINELLLKNSLPDTNIIEQIHLCVSKFLLNTVKLKSKKKYILKPTKKLNTEYHYGLAYDWFIQLLNRSRDVIQD